MIVRRRDFLQFLGSAAIAWPHAAHAQQDGRLRRVGMLMGGAESDPVWQSRAATFRDALTKLGWIEGRNLLLELRFGSGDANHMRALALELVRLDPAVIVAASQVAASAVQERTRTIPIVAVGLGPTEDPAGALIRNIARPEGNITGFPILYGTIGGKWLELLKEAAPRIVRVAAVFNPNPIRGGGPSEHLSAIEFCRDACSGFKRVRCLSPMPLSSIAGLMILQLRRTEA